MSKQYGSFRALQKGYSQCVIACVRFPCVHNWALPMKTFASIVERLKALAKGGKASSRAVVMERPQIDNAQVVAMIRKTELFANLPEEKLTAMAGLMEPVSVRSASKVIQQGDEGDYYYVLFKGSARVTRLPSGESEPEVLAELAEGTAFGEEALISNAKRNATVTMRTDGTVLKISKSDFNDNIREPLLTWASPAEAQREVRNGAKWLDIREGGGETSSRLSGAIICPIDKLREMMSELNRDGSYYCYCQNGRLSATAAFLLGQQGFKVAVMRGGLRGLERAGLI